VLISLGVLGEYLGRVYEEVKARPLYFVAEEIGFKKSRACCATCWPGPPGPRRLKRSTTPPGGV
jgi:hypothetical protein